MLIIFIFSVCIYFIKVKRFHKSPDNEELNRPQLARQDEKKRVFEKMCILRWVNAHLQFHYTGGGGA